MTPRERWLAVLNGQQPDRMPMDYWATDEATAKVLAYLGCADEWELYDRLHIDRPLEVEPAYVGPPIEWGAACWPTTGYDMYGCRFEKVAYGTGTYSECVEHPLAEYNSVEEVEENYTWPTADWFDFSVIADQVTGMDELPVRGGGSEPFLVYVNLRGMERAYMDLVGNQDLVHYCLDRLFEFRYEYSRRIYETIPGRVDISYVAEDFGSQENLLFSPGHIRTFFIARMRRMMDLAHQAGVHVFTHSDGAIRPIIPDLIEAGSDVLNPIQWRCRGMDREGLKRDFGDQLVFHGGVDNQQTLAFGSVEDVRQEVLDNIRILGAGGGYILAPCHNIQAVSPPENVVAMYETGYRYG
jgi:uroporphyrinogen decarboxylase